MDERTSTRTVRLKGPGANLHCKVRDAGPVLCDIG